jgi:hypothetical protein
MRRPLAAALLLSAAMVGGQPATFRAGKGGMVCSRIRVAHPVLWDTWAADDKRCAGHTSPSPRSRQSAAQCFHTLTGWGARRARLRRDELAASYVGEYVISSKCDESHSGPLCVDGKWADAVSHISTCRDCSPVYQCVGCALPSFLAYDGARCIWSVMRMRHEEDPNDGRDRYWDATVCDAKGKLRAQLPPLLVLPSPRFCLTPTNNVKSPRFCLTPTNNVVCLRTCAWIGERYLGDRGSKGFHAPAAALHTAANPRCGVRQNISSNVVNMTSWPRTGGWTLPTEQLPLADASGTTVTATCVQWAHEASKCNPCDAPCKPLSESEFRHRSGEDHAWMVYTIAGVVMFCGVTVGCGPSVCGARGSQEWEVEVARVRRPLRALWRPVLTEIYLCNVRSCQEILRRNGRGGQFRGWSYATGAPGTSLRLFALRSVVRTATPSLAEYGHHPRRSRRRPQHEQQRASAASAAAGLGHRCATGRRHAPCMAAGRASADRSQPVGEPAGW